MMTFFIINLINKKIIKVFLLKKIQFRNLIQVKVYRNLVQAKVYKNLMIVKVYLNQFNKIKPHSPHSQNQLFQI